MDSTSTPSCEEIAAGSDDANAAEAVCTEASSAALLVVIVTLTAMLAATKDSEMRCTETPSSLASLDVKASCSKVVTSPAIVKSKAT